MSTLRQTASYWELDGISKFGDTQYTAPRTIKVRWEEKQVLYINPEGNEVSGAGVVYSSEPLCEECYLFLGDSKATNPSELRGAFQIRATGMIPNLKNNRRLYISWL